MANWDIGEICGGKVVNHIPYIYIIIIIIIIK